jgi:hypothetical protein
MQVKWRDEGRELKGGGEPLRDYFRWPKIVVEISSDFAKLGVVPKPSVL